MQKRQTLQFPGAASKKTAQQRASINQESKQANQDWRHAIESPSQDSVARARTRATQTPSKQHKTTNQQTKKSESQVKICCRNYHRPSSQIPLTSSASSSASASASAASLTVDCKAVCQMQGQALSAIKARISQALVAVTILQGEQAARPYYS